MSLFGIVACSENHVIGKDGDLPWRLSEDLKFFKKTTMGFPIVMGRKTFESIGRPLPGRENIVLTRDEGFSREGVTVVHSLEDVLEHAREKDFFIIGGAEIYRQSLPFVKTFYVTKVFKEIEGDAFFPLEDLEKDFQITDESERFTDEKSGLAYQFFTFERR